MTYSISVNLTPISLKNQTFTTIVVFKSIPTEEFLTCKSQIGLKMIYLL